MRAEEATYIVSRTQPFHYLAMKMMQIIYLTIGLVIALSRALVGFIYLWNLAGQVITYFIQNQTAFPTGRNVNANLVAVVGVTNMGVSTMTLLTSFLTPQVSCHCNENDCSILEPTTCFPT